MFLRIHWLLAISAQRKERYQSSRRRVLSQSIGCYSKIIELFVGIRWDSARLGGSRFRGWCIVIIRSQMHECVRELDLRRQLGAHRDGDLNLIRMRCSMCIDITHVGSSVWGSRIISHQGWSGERNRPWVCLRAQAPAARIHVLRQA